MEYVINILEKEIENLQNMHIQNDQEGQQKIENIYQIVNAIKILKYGR
jgi:hypothetical protein